METVDHLQPISVEVTEDSPIRHPQSEPPASNQPGHPAHPGGDIAAGSTKPEAEDVDGASGSAPGQEEVSLSDVTYMVDPRIIDMGLKLKRPDSDLPFQSFTYSLFPTMEKSLPVSWQYLATEDIESENIRCHQLQPEDPVAELLSKFRKSYAKAVVLINTEDNYQLAQEFLVGVPQPTFPVVVVKQTDGDEIFRCLERYSGEDIHARVDAENLVDDVDVTGRTSSEPTVSPLLKKSNAAESSLSNIQKLKAKFGFHSKQVGDLKTEIKRLMFAQDKTPLVVSQDGAKYGLLMSAFHNYEKLVKKESNRGDFNDIIKKLNNHMAVFQSDFPLYLLLIFRFHKKYPKYQCDEMSQFITSCIDILELKLNIKSLAQVLDSFIQQGDFSVMYNPDGDEDRLSSVFHLLEQACLELADVSYKVRNANIANAPLLDNKSRPLYKDFIYSRMLWVSMAMKFHDARKAHITRATKSLWTERLINFHHRIVFQADAISSLKRGLEVGRLLKLPYDLSCHYQHLGDLLARDTDKTLRPFSHLANCIKMLEKFLPNPNHLITMLTDVRAVYDQYLTQPGQYKLKSVSVKGTLVGCLNEGIDFLDVLLDIFTKRKIDREMIEAKIEKWLKLLLQLVDITGPEPEVHFAFFINGTQKVMKKYKHLASKYVIHVTKENFPVLSIHQFYHLYKSFRIWSNPFLREFLNNYTIPPEVNLSDMTWRQFFGEVVSRFSTARLHFYLSDFLRVVGQKYKENKRPVSFITDLLKLKVSKLLSVENDDDKESLEIRSKFATFLHDYINRNALKHSLPAKMKDMLVSISDKRDEFQLLVLDVLRREVVPELRALQGKTLDINFKTLLRDIVSLLKNDLSWLTSLSLRQRFCWGILTTCSSKIVPSIDNFDWAQNYFSVISELNLGLVFISYCSGKKLPHDRRIIANQIPHEIASHPSEDLRKYFEWVAEIQRVLDHWSKKFLRQDISYDEVLLYANNHTKLNPLGEMVCASSLVIDFNQLQNIKTNILSEFEMLNVHLLKYIPGQPDVKWCILPVLLEDYGVYLPQNVRDIILKKVWFPGQPGQIPEDQLGTPLVPSTSGLFQPGHDVSLKLHRNTSLCDIAHLVRQIDLFQRPLMDHLQMLIFFKLHRSVLFDKYLRLYLKKIVETQQQSQETLSRMQFSEFGFSLNFPSATFSSSPVSKHDPMEEGLSTNNLVQALTSTHDLIKKIMSGMATYSEIIAEDELMLQKLDVEREFAVLSDYILLSKLSTGQCEGLDGVRSMLELFQYTSHIKNVRSVCEQYKLRRCLQDTLLNELSGLVQDHITEEDRSKMTPLIANKKMKRVKEILCLEENTSSKCLDIFAAMTDSAAFYQFVRDKQFYGQQGQAIFLQQYELITAQLQHEEYDESVLNHLLAAFKVISPFMDPQKSFTDLMKEVTSLNAVNGLKQLETVNANITLIRLWFSRAEGDTLQNVAKELECIINTGHYTFQLEAESSRGQILLKYEPFSAQLLTPSPSTSQPEGQRPPPPLIPLQSQLSELGGKPQEEMWNAEQIGDFVRKLGFMDKEKEGGKQIKQFIHLNQTANKLFELYQKLRELGHPLYLSSGGIPPISCSISQDEMDRHVHTTQHLVTEWTHEVSELRSRYSWLLYLSVPKLLQLFHLIDSTSLDAEEKTNRILHEVTFLAPNTARQRERLREGIKIALKENSKNADTAKSPMLVVGQFLDVLLKGHTLPRRCSSRDMKSLPRHRSITTTVYFAQPLYYCPAYSQGDFLTFILNIFSGIPEAYQILRCQATTTEEELSLFLKRAIQHPSHYLMLDVNKLPYKLQEHMVQLHLAMQRDHQSQPELSLQAPPSTLHFVETAPSVLREMPWIQLKDSKTQDPGSSLKDAKRMCAENVIHPSHFVCFQLVYGAAGDGKTHYIKKQLENCSIHKTIAINEAFSPVSAISKLRSLPLDQYNVGLFFNFTILPPGDSVADTERLRYRELMEVIGWFFFDLFVLGYVKDRDSGLSFRFPGEMAWAIYVEVPSRDKGMAAGESLKLFHREVPALSLLGSPHYIHPEIPFMVDSDVQLVCKYLRAYKSRVIDKEYREGLSLVKFSREQDLADEDCHKLLNEYMPKHILSSKITQKLFIKYMKRRCDFLDCLPAFNFNTGSAEYLTNEVGVKVATDTRRLGSTLMHTMLSEVSDFCDPSIKENWSVKAHQQLIYDFKDGGASLGLISLHPDQLREAEKMKFKKIGVKIPSMIDLYSRELLDSYLSRALNVELEKGRLSVIDESAYVLTLDYTIKMLNIHERYECGIPVIIEGETGVGKTALVEMLSKLWNQSLLLEWKKQRGNLLDFFQKELGDMDIISDNYQMCVQAVESLSSGDISEDTLLVLCNHGKFHDQLKKLLRPMRNDPMIPLLTFKATHTDSLDELFDCVEISESPEKTARLLQAIFTAQVTPTFHKINVHAAMTPAKIKSLFQPVFAQARLLHAAYQEKLTRVKSEDKLRKSVSTPTRRSVLSSFSSIESDDTTFSPPPPSPFVTVFLDEVNTSSCLGLFKEIIVDKNFDGEPIPDNIFIVAACNPHRGNSLASHETWMRGTYYVRSLHPTLRFLMWDYGSLDEHQERDYINAKMKMVNKTMEKTEVASLTDLIVTSQNMMREFAFRQLSGSQKQKSVQSENLCRIASRSCVSQRDIQRVFTFYQWFKTMYDKHRPHKERNDYHRRAVLVALGIVYYMRLNAECRKEYKQYLDEVNRMPNEVSFSAAFDEELEYYIGQVELPKGIARTLALKENLFATIICTITHTPLIIVGAPGSSKTLSFNQTIANLKGQESKKQLFRNTEIFRSLDPHYYQCSRRTTSNEIQTVFSRAVNRQRSHQRFNLPIYCVVFMDEAGLPEESHESLKVLHYHLDKQEVSFVAITNHVLDAAKTNRAISLFRPEASDEDLETLAKGCLCSNLESPPPELQRDLVMVAKFCQPYSDCMKSSKFARFFGLRDFIQFVNYLRRKRDEGQVLSSHLVMQALERNFNGSVEFENICKKFLQVIGTKPADVPKRKILDILQDSMRDRPQAMQDLTENEVRYKLIIDPSEDDSLVRLLFSMGVLTRDNTRMFVCSDFPGDGQLQKVNTIAAIRHSAIEGHTVVMSQTDDIHESFYDLFNQRFRRIDDPEHGPRYYTNIAIGAHLKPSRVHPNFQCVVVVKNSEVEDTPSPFLNRFEKYFISHGNLLETALQNLPPCMAIMIQAAKEKVNDFICQVLGYQSLYGLQPETLDSLILDLFPPLNHTYQELGEDSVVDTEQEVPIYLLKEIFNALRNNVGFNIPRYPLDELHDDAAHVFSLILCDPEYEGLLQTLTHQEAMRAVVEAFNLLYSAPAPQDEGGQKDITPEGCMVLSLLQQLLVRLFTKRLMQLMTTEAIILNRKKIPFSYLANYLSNQAHFSLKDLITQYHKAVAVTLSDPFRTPNKLVCFTRSSPLVHTLPAQFPSSMMETPQDLDIVANLVFEDTDKLVIHKLSSLLSQSSVQELLRDFVVSETAEVCLLLANMQETSLKTINHIRLMMEEAELLRAHKQSTKVFVLLLHFPPALFFRHCYPSLFLKGWDHCYLDTIAHSTVEGVVDIKDWFYKCCFPSQEANPDKPDGLFKALMHLLPQAIPVISARVYFGNKKDASFNSFMNATQRSEALKKLLFDCEIGQVLCEKFCAYWKPRVMAEYLERAATFSKQRESTLNITDSIQTQFKALYLDFCVYMLTRANENFNLDIIFAENSSPSLRKLFIDIFRVFPTPKLNQLNLLSNNLPLPQPSLHCPRFPFFGCVCGLMEKQMEVSGEAANLQVDMLAEKVQEPVMDSLSVGYAPSNPADKLQALVNAIMVNMEPIMNAYPKQVLGLAIEAMASDPDLWHHYFNDFIIYKLKLGGDDRTPEGDIAQLILHTYFQQIHSYDALKKVVELHSYVSVYQLSLAQMASILRPLNKLQGLGLQQEPHLLSPMTPTPTSPANQLLLAVEQTQHPLGSPIHLSSFIIGTLFDALLGATYNTTPKFLASRDHKLVIWFKSYRDIMTLPMLKHYVYISLSMPEAVNTSFNLLEAKLNVMQATFLILQSSPSLDQDALTKGHQTFQALLNRYFKEDMQLKDSRPSLAGVTEVAVELVSSLDFNASLHRCNPAVRLVMEGLLAHFFPPDRPQYHTEDILWFLKLANEQEQWSANPFEGEEESRFEAATEESVGVVAGGLEDDLLSKLEESTLSKTTPSNTELLPGAIEISMFKFYLARVLGNYVEPSGGGADQQELGPLLLYRQESRSLVGKVLMSKKNLGPPGPYIPVFYQNSPPIIAGVNAKNGRMQQSLCHLYFLTLMEHLRSESRFKNPSRLSLLVRTAVTLQKQLDTAEGPEAVLLWVELQAVTQVMIQQLALNLDPSQPHMLGDIQLVIDDINLFLDSSFMGGGDSQGHAMVLSLHLLKLLKSSRRFTDLMTGKYDFLSNIKCLQPIHLRLKSPSEMKPHLLPFLQPGAEGELSVLYKQVSLVMLGIHNGSKELDDLLHVAQNCVQSAGGGASGDQRLSFRMVVWLATYYEFYDKKVVSPLLCNVMGGQEMSNYLQEEGYIRLIQCFLQPDLMLQRKESPNSLTERQVLELGPDGRPQVIPRQGDQQDPLYQLFIPAQPDDIDQSDVDLRHSMANLLAVVLGSPSRSNHLWYHLFAANKLQRTYMTGFMYDSTIHHDGLLYDCGVELSPEGQFGRQDYKKHACRGTYTLHSLYLLLWANFSAFCLALLTQPDADQRIHGPIISEWLSVRHYCVSQLRTLWMHMRNNLGLSEEQRSFFIMRAMNRLHELLTKSSSSLTSVRLTVPLVPEIKKGIFETREDLDRYEKMWHMAIYQPTWDELPEKFVELSNQQQNKLFSEIRRLEMHYPHLPSEQEFSHAILSAGDLEQQSEGGKLRLLTRFAMEWPLLKMGGDLLPDLVELYRWLHMNIAHLITYERASSLTIGHVIQLVEMNSSKEMGEHLRNLYERVKLNYNHYVELIGGAIGAGACAAVRHGNKIFTIADEIPLLHFLSDVEEEDQGNDWLHVVITNIIANHNNTIENLYSLIQTTKHAPLARLLPEEPSTIHPTEVTPSHSIVSHFTELHGVSSFLQLVRSRYQPTIPGERPAVLPPSSSFVWASIRPRPEVSVFQLGQLEEDMVTAFITGKPLIKSPLLLRTLFRFKKDKQLDLCANSDMMYTALDLQDMTDSLPENFKASLSGALLKRFEYEFHSASFHLMLEVVTALRTVVGHTIKSLQETRQEDTVSLEMQKVPEFMLNLYEHLTKEREVLYEIGIQSASPSHISCLAELPLSSVYCCLKLFFGWIEEGYYDFSALPFAFKVHMSYQDKSVVDQQLRLKWQGSVPDLLEELQNLIDVLKHSEQDITSRVNEAANKPIVEYLIEYHMLEEEGDHLARHIPRTIMLHHYVAFRLSLRRLHLRVQQELEGSSEGEGDLNIWSEFISDLWEKHLPHLREELYGEGLFVFNPNTGCYGFQEEEEEEGEEFEDCVLTSSLLGDDADKDGRYEREGMESVSYRIRDSPGMEEGSFTILSEETHTLDLNRSSSDEEEEGIGGGASSTETTPLPGDLEDRLKNDPELKKRVLSIVQSDTSLEELARKFSAQDVSDFLTKIQLPEYADSFLSSDISGEILLEADADILNELGVTSPLHQMKIMELFRRELQGEIPRYSREHMSNFLQQYKLDKYGPMLETHGIDGDMILGVEEKLMKSVLREVGVTSLVDNLKIRSKYKTFVSDDNP